MMASLVSLKEKLTEVKLGELLSWVVMTDFTPRHCRSLSERL